MLLVGDSPIEHLPAADRQRAVWPDGIGYTLFYATPLIFTGLAVAVAFRCGLLNIGAEGQLYVAAFADRLGRDHLRAAAGRGCWCRCASLAAIAAGARVGRDSRACSRRGSGRTRSSTRS